MCVRAEKNSELSKTSKMKLLDKIVKIFKNTNYFCNNVCLRCRVKIHLRRVFVLEIPINLTCGNSFCKVTGSKAIISMNEDSTREKVWWILTREKHLLKLLKRKNSHECFHKPAAYWKWTPPLTISWKLS